MVTNNSIPNRITCAWKDLYNHIHTNTLILHLISKKLLGLENTWRTSPALPSRKLHWGNMCLHEELSDRMMIQGPCVSDVQLIQKVFIITDFIIYFICNNSYRYFGAYSCNLIVLSKFILLPFLLRLPWIFPEAPLKLTESPGNIQGNWTALCYPNFAGWIPGFRLQPAHYRWCRKQRHSHTRKCRYWCTDQLQCKGVLGWRD